MTSIVKRNEPNDSVSIGITISGPEIVASGLSAEQFAHAVVLYANYLKTHGREVERIGG